jgi:tripeptide aminopeptidase
MIDSERLLQRFLRYVRIDTTAGQPGGGYPSSPGQLQLGKLLAEELRALGLVDAQQDQHGIVMATLPATIHADAPAIAFCAHMDTSPETTAAGVRPQVWRGYAGDDLVLPGDRTKVIRVSENPELRDLVGKTIVTTDGTTLLGADDKAGVAAIVEAVAYWREHPEVPHGPIRICFTCDEEIGHGVDHIDVAQLGAVVCYTLDGSGADMIDVETFSADLATIHFRGVNIHPSIAKGRMINAIRAAAHFIDRLPRNRLSPETTEWREGFLHPYGLEGGVGEAKLKILLRDFELDGLAAHAGLLQRAAADTQREFPGLDIEIQIEAQYRNLREGLAREPRAVEYARVALKRLGREAKLTIVRGGTDGSRLTELGLPTPNLSTGEHNPHSCLEWTCLEEMIAAVEWIVEIGKIWAEDPQKKP